MRLIDADEIAYESIDSSDTAREETCYGHGIFAVRKEDIDAMPTIEERKKGIWTDLGGVIRWGCPHCHHTQEVRYNFCPNCGADMR